MMITPEQLFQAYGAVALIGAIYFAWKATR